VKEIKLGRWANARRRRGNIYFDSLDGMIGAAKADMAFMARRTTDLLELVAAFVLLAAVFANVPAVLLATFTPWDFRAVFFTTAVRLPTVALDLRLAAIFDF
jgi:hypothetical protein